MSSIVDAAAVNDALIDDGCHAALGLDHMIKGLLSETGADRAAKDLHKRIAVTPIATQSTDRPVAAASFAGICVAPQHPGNGDPTTVSAGARVWRDDP